ncbi:unnamed protein product [Ectocarpus sp. 12 AP-2014]
MSFLNAAKNVAAARAKAATAKAVRSFSMASKARESNSRRFWPAERFSERRRDIRRPEVPPSSTSHRRTEKNRSTLVLPRSKAAVEAKFLLLRRAGDRVGGANDARRGDRRDKLLRKASRRGNGGLVPASPAIEYAGRKERSTERKKTAGQMAALLRVLAATNQAVPAVGASPPARVINMRMFDKTLRGYEKAGKWRHALGLLSRMMNDESSGVRPDSSTFGMVVSTCVKAGRWREASNVVLREMPTHGVTPDATTYTSVIDVCGKWGRWEESFRLLDEMAKAGLNPSVSTYNNAITLCGSGGRFQLAVDLLDRMLATGVTPNVASYNSVMTACDHMGQWRQVLGLLRRMEETGGVQPSVRSFNIAIKAVGDTGDCEAALALFREMSAAGIVPNMDSYSTVIKAFNRAGRVDGTVSGLLEEMSESMKVNPEADTIAIGDSTIDTSPTSAGMERQAGKTWRQTVALTREVERSALSTSHNGTAASLGLSAAEDGEIQTESGSSGGKATEALNHENQEGCAEGEAQHIRQRALVRLQNMSETEIPQTAGSYSLAITQYGHSGQWEHSLALLKQMALVGIPPNRKCYHSAIAACGISKKHEEALELLRVMEKAGFTLTDKSYRCAISACGNAGRFKDCVSLLREAAAAGLPPNPGTYSLAIMACGDAGKWEKALSLLREAEALDIVANGTCYNAAVKACKDCSKPEEAAAVLARSKKHTTSACPVESK